MISTFRESPYEAGQPYVQRELQSLGAWTYISSHPQFTREFSRPIKTKEKLGYKHDADVDNAPLDIAISASANIADHMIY